MNHPATAGDRTTLQELLATIHQVERGAAPFRGATNKAGHSPSSN